MKTITINLYKYDELPTEEAKEKAVEQFREKSSGEYSWAEEWHKSIQEFCETFGITYKNSTVGTSPDVRYSLGQIDDNILALKGRRLIAYLINNYYDMLFEHKHYGEYREVKPKVWRYKRYSKCQWQETCCPFTGYCGDEDCLQPIREYLKKPNLSTDLEDLLRDCIGEWEKGVRADCEYQESDEAIIESITANEYDFEEDGTWH